MLLFLPVLANKTNAHGMSANGYRDGCFLGATRQLMGCSALASASHRAHRSNERRRVAVAKLMSMLELYLLILDCDALC